MSKRNIEFDLDFEQEDILPKFSIKQFDNALISISTFLRGEPLNPAGNTCKLYVSTGNDVFLQESNIRTLENLVEIDLDKNVISLDGKAFGELELKDDNGTFTSATFIFNIDNKVGEGSTLPNGVEGFIAKHERLIREFKEEINPKIDTINNSISDINIKDSEQDSKLYAVESKNTEQDVRLKDIEYKNKVQDTYISGLFNENDDKRLTLEGEGNNLKLEGSKEGLVTVDKVVGNTLVNLFGGKISDLYGSGYREEEDGYITIYQKVYGDCIHLKTDMYKPSTTYTLIVDVKSNTLPVESMVYVDRRTYVKSTDGQPIGAGKTGIFKFKFMTIEDFSTTIDNKRWGFYFTFAQADVETKGDITLKFTLLEGDYTNKPIPSEYFEGMKSTFEECKVMQEMINSGEELEKNLGKYKVEVKVKGKNLFDFDTYTMENVLNSNVTVDSIDKAITMQRTNSGKYEYVEFDVNLQANTPYVLSYNIDTLVNNSKPLRRFEFVYSDGTTKAVLHGTTSFEKINEQKRIKKIRVCMEVIGSDKVILSKIQIEGDTQTSYEPYYERTQTVYLNSPPHKGDEIVCKEDGLYHYHKMSKVILDGGENWTKSDVSFYKEQHDMKRQLDYTKSGTLCDKLPVLTYHVNALSSKGIAGYGLSGDYMNQNWLYINNGVSRTLEEFKSWLQDNPITVVYELVEPYYEKISDDKLLLEIPNSATLSVESVIPCQNISATYTGNVPSVYGLEETNKNQDDLIDITLCATDEMYMMLEPILEAMPQTIKNERMVSKMVDMYVAMVIRGLKTIEEVPARYRKEVQAMLDKLEK